MTDERLLKIINYVRRRVAIYGITWLVLDMIVSLSMTGKQVNVCFWLAVAFYFVWVVLDLFVDAINRNK